MPQFHNRAIQGMGLGLRYQHLPEVLKSRPDISWWEVMVEDLLEPGPHHQSLQQLRRDYPLVCHSIGLNIAGVDRFQESLMARYREIYNQLEPQWISDHLCWSGLGQQHFHELLPFPKNHFTLDHICSRIDWLQDFFKRPLLVENITSYVGCADQLEEWEFLNQMTLRTGCYLLLDVSNVLINSHNRGLDAEAFFSHIDLQRVKQVHLAGGRRLGDWIVDSHGEAVAAADIAATQKILQRAPHIAVMIERDTNIPPLRDLVNEVHHVRQQLFPPDTSSLPQVHGGHGPADRSRAPEQLHL